MPDYTTINNAERRLAFVHSKHTSPDPGILFCGGFKSNMHGLKALAFEAFCKEHKVAYTRFDYSGHGNSSGEFTEGDIDAWLNDALCIFDQVSRASSEKILLIGSSMGAWIATLIARERPADIAGLLTIAAAPDFTERLLLPSLTTEERQLIESGKTVNRPSDYDDGSPYTFSANLIEKSRQHCVLDSQIKIDAPVRLLHGTGDKDVPFALSIALMEAIQSSDVKLTLIKGADHRLSSAADLQLTHATLQAMLSESHT